jgi:4-hydroxyphenylpyruvate dioxygenase
MRQLAAAIPHYEFSAQLFKGAPRPTADMRQTYTGPKAFDHVEFWVGNAKQVASYYVARFGFTEIAYRGLETGSRYIASHVVEQGCIRFVFSSPLRGPGLDDLVDCFHQHQAAHGDGVRDVAFEVDDARLFYYKAINSGAIKVKEPWKECDEDGEVIFAQIKAFGDTIHTFVQRSAYRGVFLPGFRPVNRCDLFESAFENIGLMQIDHIVANNDWEGMIPVCEYYENVFGFHRFWSPDDRMSRLIFQHLGQSSWLPQIMR